MQISSSPDIHSYLSKVRSASGPDHEKPVSGFSKDTGPRSPSVGDIFSNYDMEKISPRDIDKLANELRDSGHKDFEFLLMLETKGEKFLINLPHLVEGTGSSDDLASFDPEQVGNLLDQTRDAISSARQRGSPTAAHEKFLERLETYNKPHFYQSSRANEAKIAFFAQL